MARPKRKPENLGPLETVRGSYYAFVELLEGVAAERDELIAKLVADVNNLPHSDALWRGIAAYRDLRGEKTLLMVAVHSRADGLAKKLIEAGANVYHRDTSGRTLAHYAAAGNNSKFLKHIASTFRCSNMLFMRNCAGMTPADVAEFFNHKEVSETLRHLERVIERHDHMFTLNEQIEKLLITHELSLKKVVNRALLLESLQRRVSADGETK